MRLIVGFLVLNCPRVDMVVTNVKCWVASAGWAPWISGLKRLFMGDSAAVVVLELKRCR